MDAGLRAAVPGRPGRLPGGRTVTSVTHREISPPTGALINRVYQGGGGGGAGEGGVLFADCLAAGFLFFFFVFFFLFAKEYCKQALTFIIHNVTH